MATASIAGKPFRVDPTSVSWEFRAKVAEKTTIGGVVVQAYGADFGPLVVSGSFGKGGWQEQRDFLQSLAAAADRQASNFASDPPRFLFPAKGWDFLVYLRGFSQPGSFASVLYENPTFNPPWQLTMTIVEDNSPIKVGADALTAGYIQRLSAGLGWQQTKYNGPLDVTMEAKQFFGTWIAQNLQTPGATPGSPAPAPAPAPPTG